jgi:hypothetical protein
MSARTLVRLLAICALLNLAVAAQAGTIIKLNLGSVGPDIALNQGQLGTVDDSVPGTTGNQNTNIEFTDFLDVIPDVTTSIASFTLSGLTATGPAQTFGTLVIQNFTGGSFSLYDPSNNLLLSGSLGSSALTGVAGPPGTASLFTTSLTSATGGSLASQILPGSLSLSFSMTNVNGGAGFSTSDGFLQPFQTDASVLIAGTQTQAPEPSTLGLLGFGAIALIVRRRFAK